MLLDSTQLGTFRSRFEAKEPDPKNFIRRATKLDFYLTVADLIEERRGKGFAWDGIAEDFAALGVEMPVSTLKTCFRRARERNQAPRPKRPSRRTSPRRGSSDAPQSDDPSIESPPAAEAGFERPIDATPSPQAAVSPAATLDRSAASVGTTDTSARESAPPEASPAGASPANGVAAQTLQLPAGEAALASAGSREKEVAQEGDRTTIAQPDAPIAAPQGPSDAERARRGTQAAGGVAAKDSPQSAASELAGGTEKDPAELTRPPPAAGLSHGLGEIRARASPPEKRRLAFVPRADEEL